MAECSSATSNQVVCRFFLSSSCRDGDRCLFSHDSTRCIPDKVCRYYLQGTCFFGQNCRYDHILVNMEDNFKNCSHSDDSAGLLHHPEKQDVLSNSKADSKINNSYQPRTNSSSHSAVKNEVSSSNEPSAAFTNWVNAPEYVPKNIRSFADIVKASTVIKSDPEKLSSTELCSDHMIGACPFKEQCPYVHGNMCELCLKACLHPYDEKQMAAHIEFCEKELEKNMEISFAIQRSVDQICGICMEVVWEKELISARRFGIHEKCNHVFCLTCVKKWRRSKRHDRNQHIGITFRPDVTRGCPECRIVSDFIIPSMYCVDNEEDKKKLITDYKNALSKKPCKYFKQGEGTCPFGGACFYLHAKPDGSVVDLPLPTRRRRRNRNSLIEFLRHEMRMERLNLPMILPYLNISFNDLMED